MSTHSNSHSVGAIILAIMAGAAGFVEVDEVEELREATASG